MQGNMQLMRSQSLRDMQTQGAEARAIGDAANKLRCMALTCGVCPLIFAATMCGVYWGLMNKGNAYNDAFANWSGGELSAFDTCGGLMEGTTNADGTITAEYIDTKWSVILAFNSYFYLVHCIMTLLVLCGATGVLWPCCCLGGCGHCFSPCAHIAAIVVTGVFRLNDNGELCSKNKAVVDGDLTFEEMGDKIKSLFIA